MKPNKSYLFVQGNGDLPTAKGLVLASPVVHFGDKTKSGTTDEIDAAPWDQTFFNTASLEYTANSLAYDSNPDSTEAIFDLATDRVE